MSGVAVASLGTSEVVALRPRSRPKAPQKHSPVPRGGDFRPGWFTRDSVEECLQLQAVFEHSARPAPATKPLKGQSRGPKATEFGRNVSCRNCRVLANMHYRSPSVLFIPAKKQDCQPAKSESKTRPAHLSATSCVSLLSTHLHPPSRRIRFLPSTVPNRSRPAQHARDLAQLLEGRKSGCPTTPTRDFRKRSDIQLRSSGKPPDLLKRPLSNSLSVLVAAQWLYQCGFPREPRRKGHAEGADGSPACRSHQRASAPS